MRTWFCAALLVMFCGVANSAVALPTVPKYVKKAFGEQPGYEGFNQKYAALKSKCDTCHYPGSDKKKDKEHGLNDFGRVLHKKFKDDPFKEADKAKNEAEAMKIFRDAWDQSMEEKNAAGEKFGDRIKEGNLPGEAEKPAETKDAG